MDGGRRLLRPVGEVLASFAPATQVAAVGMPVSGKSVAIAPRRLPALRTRRRPRRGDTFGRICALATRQGFGTLLVAAFAAVVGGYGVVRGGGYDAFIADNGSVADTIARTFGFGLHAITITGQRELTTPEILAASGVSERNSLLFLNAARTRDNLKSLPLVEQASVRKLYPDRLLIEVTERGANAVWQKDGDLAVVAADGTVIDAVKDDRFSHLPFVVGEGANKRVGEYLKIVDAAGELRARIRAGVLISQRRWNLKMNSGIDVKLPEQSPEAAVAKLAGLQRDYRVLDKDIIAVDLRVQGKLVVRISEDAAAQRAEALAKKHPAKRGPA